MIDQETIFIIGAGASRPYGYPTGYELRKYICINFPPLLRRISGNSQFSHIRAAWNSEAKELAKVFEKSSTPSIDLFLARNNNFSEIGKIAILLSIFEAERKSRFRENSHIEEQDWYSYLYQKM